MTENKKRICGAKTRSGGKCHSRPMPNGRCRLHGGKTPGGLNSPNLKHGRHSKYLPKNLLATYKEALQDQNLLQLHDEIALIDARLAEVLGKVQAGKDLNQWESIQTEFAGLLTALQGIPAVAAQITGKENPNAVALQAQWRGPKKLKTERLDEASATARLLETLANLGNLIVTGIDTKEAWDMIQALIEQRRKLVESERKWYIENQQVITAEKALILIAAIAEIIKTNVSDTKTRQTIIENINRLALSESV